MVNRHKYGFTPDASLVTGSHALPLAVQMCYLVLMTPSDKLLNTFRFGRTETLREKARAIFEEAV